MAKVRGNGAQLDQALRDIGHAWGNTADGWRDQARQDFDDHHYRELDLRARHAVRAVSMIEDLLREAERECT